MKPSEFYTTARRFIDGVCKVPDQLELIREAIENHDPPTVYGPTPADPDELEREANELIAEIQKAVDERKCTPVTTSEPQSGKRVFDSAVALAEYWDGLHELFREFLRAESPELCTLLSANSAAVKGAVSDD